MSAIQQESKLQTLPRQEETFAVSRRVRSRLTHLPDPTRPPLGYEPGRAFDKVFPFIGLPELKPTLNGDWVKFGSPDLEPNRLYHGDNLQVLRTLPSESIDLIYIDPPFFSGRQYNTIWGDSNEVRSFNDIWDGGMDTYLIWLNARIWEMRRALKSTGSIYVHCDWHASHYIKTEMDRVFGYGSFTNEIIWRYRRWPSKQKAFQRMHDILLWYRKSNDKNEITWNQQYEELSESSKKMWGGKLRVDRKTEAGTRFSETNDKSSPGVPMTDVWEVSQLSGPYKEYLGYPTQKPEALIERVVKACSNEGDVVADFFCGGGTTLAVAQKLGRRWIGSDISRVAVSVTLNRAIKICEEQSGVMSNYGKKTGEEIQRGIPLDKSVPDIRVGYVGVYPMDRFKAVDQDDFTRFVLKCYGASQDASECTAISGWRTQREPLFVGPADPDQAPNVEEVKNFFEACLKNLQPNNILHARVLAWKFSPQLNAYRKTLLSYISKNLPEKNVAMDFDFVSINSPEFRERIALKVPDPDENEFLLRFTQPPMVGSISAKKQGGKIYTFEAQDTQPLNPGGYLVNCQWDFDFQRGHFNADSEHVLGRQVAEGPEAEARGQKFEAILKVEHEFAARGTFTVACRVQDNLGGETIKTVEVEVS